MSIVELNHFFVRANDLDQSRRFYCEGLGLEQLPRPDFSFPGYWLGVAGKAIVHMGPAEDPTAEQYYSSSGRTGAQHASAVDHVAFSANNPEQFVRRLRGLGLEPKTRYIADFKVFQLVVKDPNGITVELNFQDVESEPVMTS
ncbi:MAG: VOC family protein [Steroidobacteraceae bacterium]